MFAILLISLLSLLAIIWNFVWKRRGLPPGPVPFPIFGNTLAMKSSLYEPFQRWAHEYGPVYTMWLGEQPLVVVTDFETMRQLFVKDGDTFAGRHGFVELFMQFKASNGQVGGVVLTEGEPWKVMRRFGLQAMRNLGVGKASLERQYRADIRALVAKLREELSTAKLAADKGNDKEGAEVVDLQPHIELLIGSTINRLLFGYAFSDDQLNEFFEQRALIDEQNELLATMTGRLLMGTPSLRHLPIFSGTFAAIDKMYAEMHDFYLRPIRARMAEREKRVRARESGEEPGDMLDHFLDQMEKTSEHPELAEHFNMYTLTQLCGDLFLAGQETTSNTLGFLVLYLLLDQRVQAKVHAELDRLEAEKAGQNHGNVEDDEDISLADRQKLPYLNAVINECQRHCNLLPINLIHRTMADVEILGHKFLLKKGTPIVYQISAVLFDEKIFPNPQRFEPERFLDDQGQLKRCEQLIPFGMGKRICMGKSLARMELFLFTANFFRHFRVLPVDPLNPPPFKRVPGFTVSTQPYKCRLISRENGRRNLDS